jgi:hypothetical protein
MPMRRVGGGPITRIIGLVLAIVVTGGCAGSPGTGGTKTAKEPMSASPSAAEADLRYVALGDSWPEGAHCDPACITFPELHAEAIEKITGQSVTFMNLSGQAQPYFDTPGLGGSAGLLKALRDDEEFRSKVAEGDVIVISTGPNDIGDAFDQIMAGTCGGKDDADCVEELGRTWEREFDLILDEIETLRVDKPTAIRLVNAANAWFKDPSHSRETANGLEAVFQLLTDAMCHSAQAHGAVCVDVRPVLNGPGFEQPVNDSTQESMEAVADLLIDTDIPELPDV